MSDSRYSDGKPSRWQKNKSRFLMWTRQKLGTGRAADVLVLGGQRCGSRSLFRYLSAHPQVEPAARVEVNYFSVHYGRGRGWYESHFSNNSHGRVKLDVSPSYIFSPAAPERVARDLPDAKFVALLRNPIDRAYSHYRHMKDQDRDPLTFEEALGEEEARIAQSEPASRAYSYRTRGIYADQLERWFATLPRERFHVAISDEVFSDSRSALTEICDFIGIAPQKPEAYTHWNAQAYAPIAPETRAELAAFYAPHNRRLATILGRDLPW